MLVEKRIAGVIKWLERLKKSYSSGAIESALMDAECAKADLETLRLAVWKQAGAREISAGAGVLKSIACCARVLSLAVIIVMVHVMPLSREVKPPVIVEQPQIETVLREPIIREPIIVIREAEPQRQDKTADIPAKRQTPQKRTASKRTQTASAASNTGSSPQTSRKAGTVPYDKVYSLLQTGQRALKNNSSVIKIK